jgi:cell division protein FtsB
MSEVNNSNKNMWLAVSLAVITSVTSLGTAFISKDTTSIDDLNEKVEKLEEDYKSLQAVNEKLHSLIILANDKIKDCSCN